MLTVMRAIPSRRSIEEIENGGGHSSYEAMEKFRFIDWEMTKAFTGPERMAATKPRIRPTSRNMLQEKYQKRPGVNEEGVERTGLTLSKR